MFISKPHGSESIQALAAQIGLVFGETCGTGTARAGFIGNTFPVKDALKAAGARWDGLNKAWTFDDWAAAETALKAITH